MSNTRCLPLRIASPQPCHTNNGLRLNYLSAYTGPTRTGGKKFRRVLHQVREPLSSITALCAEKIFVDLIGRHIPYNSSREKPNSKGRSCLEFWVQWHSFLTEMKFPTYQIENVAIKDIFQISGLGHLYLEQPLNITTNKNQRKHRENFSWQEIYTLDPVLAEQAFELAHYYGYTYPDVDFDSLTCLDWMPSCFKDKKRPTNCIPGTHAYQTDTQKIINMMTPTVYSLGFTGWVDSGCIEYKVPSHQKQYEYIGLRGLLSEYDLHNLNILETDLFLELNKTILQRILPLGSGVSYTGSSQPLHVVAEFHIFCIPFITTVILLRLRRRYIRQNIRKYRGIVNAETQGIHCSKEKG